MAKCACGNRYPDARKELGYDNCLVCGEQQAAIETEQKEKRVMPLHKSNSVYVGDNRDTVLEITNMRRG